MNTSKKKSSDTTQARPETTGVGLVKPPPDVKAPAVPAGFVRSNPKDYRGFRPKDSELAVIPDVIVELAQFDDYESVFGRTAPAVLSVIQALEAASQWTALLSGASDWDAYVRSQEGMAWKDTLTLVDKLKGPFELASAHDPSIAARYPALARLVAAAKVIAKRGVATRKRRASEKAKEHGAQPKPPAPQPTPPAPQPAPAFQSQAAHAVNGLSLS